MNCTKSSCKNKAKFQVGIKLYPAGWGKLKDPATGLMEVYVCEEHKSFASKEFLLTDAGWKNVCNGFKMVGKCEPDRDLAEIELIEL